MRNPTLYLIQNNIMKSKTTFFSSLLFAANFLLATNASAQAISGGSNHSLSICNTNTLKAWGSNTYGQLGDGTTTDRLTPTSVSSITGVTKVEAGNYHSIALKSSGTVHTWGFNSKGQLGDGTLINKSIPVTVSGLTGMTAVAAGADHSLALKNDGTVWAWGWNSNGQLGDGTTVDKTTPIQVPGLTGVIAISAGEYHSLALKSDGTVWKWGSGVSTPAAVTGLSSITAIASGEFHFLALKNDGTVWAWGGTNLNGEYGNGTSGSAPAPVQVSTITGVIEIAAGMTHSLAIKSDGTVWAWGLNNWGQLGDVSTTTRTTPVQMSGITSAASIAAGDIHSFVVKSDGTLKACGGNFYGQIGNGTAFNSYSTPVTVTVCAILSLNSEVKEQFLVTVYPNPTQNTITISTQKTIELSIVNVLGETVLKTTAKDKDVIDVSGLSNGIYFIRSEVGKAIRLIKQ